MAKTVLMELEKNDFHKMVEINKLMCSNHLEDRLKLYAKRFISSESEDTLTAQEFYPDMTMANALSEIESEFPMELIPTGDKADMLRTSLLKYSFLSKIVQNLNHEILLSTEAFLRVIPKPLNKEGILMKMDMEILPSEKIWKEEDPVTKQIKSITYEFETLLYQQVTNETIKCKVREVYDIDNVSIFVRDSYGGDLADYPDQIHDNPFKSIGKLPVIRFKGWDYNNEPFATKLINSQLEIDNCNTNLNRQMNLDTNQIFVINNSTYDRVGSSIGAGSMICLMEGETAEYLSPKLNIDSIRNNLEKTKDALFVTAGLLPYNLRQKVYGTDSSKVTKISQGQLIGRIRAISKHIQTTFDDLIDMTFLANGLERVNERLEVSKEVLMYDMGDILNQYAIGINLGLYDDEMFWERYETEFTDVEKDRIKKYFAKRLLVAGDVSTSDTNTSNIASAPKPKKKPTSKTESKEKMDKEQRDGTTVQ